jgi:alternate signal-mediated exported protein
MKNQTKGIVAAGAGVALLLGGSTFALWSDSASAPGGTITSGNLDVEAVSPVAWWDVSPDRVSSPHVIENLDTWRIVPGDTIAGLAGLDIALEGDNLVAQLEVTTDPAPTGGLLPEGEGDVQAVTLTYSVYEGALTTPEEIAAATPLSGAADVALGTPTELLFQADSDGQEAGVDDADIEIITSDVVDGTADVTVVVEARFPPEVDFRIKAQTQALLGDMSFALAQVRAPEGGAGFNGNAP